MSHNYQNVLEQLQPIRRVTAEISVPWFMVLLTQSQSDVRLMNRVSKKIYGPARWAPNTPIHTDYTIYQLGAHSTDSTRIQQGPITRAHRKTLGEQKPRYQYPGPPSPHMHMQPRVRRRCRAGSRFPDETAPGRTTGEALVPRGMDRGPQIRNYC